MINNSVLVLVLMYLKEMENKDRSLTMPKHYKEMMDEIINKIDEDAPANAVGDGGNVALPPKHEPGVKKDKRKEIDPLMFAKPIKRKIRESDDNNNINKNNGDKINNGKEKERITPVSYTHLTLPTKA